MATSGTCMMYLISTAVKNADAWCEFARSESEDESR